MKIVSPEEMQKWEHQTIASGVPVLQLMQEAVTGLFDIISSKISKRPVILLCGKGNNGNDALWLADLLKSNAWITFPILTHEPGNRTSIDAEPIRRSLERATVWPNFPDELYSNTNSILVIDGLMGIGAKGAPKKPYSEILEVVQKKRRSADVYLSIDTPSGLDAETGELLDPYFQADMTIAIGAVKLGCLKRKAQAGVGRLFSTPITLESNATCSYPTFFTKNHAIEILSRPRSDTYKHQRGRVHIWAGSPGMCGAAILASRAALRSGAGLVTLFTSEEIYRDLLIATPEVMVRPLYINDSLNPLIFKGDAILVGPGIGLTDLTKSRFQEFVSEVNTPLVVDADALTLCAESEFQLNNLPKNTVLTPHAGEFQRLFKKSSGEHTIDACEFINKNQHLILCLKGPNTLVTAKPFEPSFNETGNPGLATAGSGDVLAGLISGLIASGYSSWDATRVGVFWHGLSADLAVNNQSETSLIASDIIDFLGKARMAISNP